MKLISLQIPERYNGLENINIAFRRHTGSNIEELSPICLVGLNGSGKSNVIEALSEIFCLVDLSIKPYQKVAQKSLLPTFSFVLNYIINDGSQERQVRIEGVEGKAVQVFLLSSASNLDSDDASWESIRSENIAELLPTRIVGYSSGHNETISFPYLKSETYYSEEVRTKAFVKHSNQDDAALSFPNENTTVPSPSGLFVDYDFNALMFIANSFFYPDRLQSSLEHLRLAGLRSFRIKICFQLSSSNYVVRTRELDAIVEKLQSCALLKQGDPDTSTGLTLDFYVNQITCEQVKEHFETAINFFESLHQLYLLNALKLPGPEKNYYKNDQRKGGLVPRPPVVPDRERVFTISAVQVKLQNKTPDGKPSVIDYAAISDGEHQFMLIFGTLSLFDGPETLFLLDEPESHFNPKWRSEFVKLATDMLSLRADAADLPELVISTHSPFVVSGCKAQNVFKFFRSGNTVRVTQPSEETYGASFDYLLATLFDLEALIATKPAAELRAILQSNSPEQLEEAKEKFGSSIEKAAIFVRLDEIENAREQV